MLSRDKTALQSPQVAAPGAILDEAQGQRKVDEESASWQASWEAAYAELQQSHLRLQQGHMRQLQEQERHRDSEAATATRLQEELAAQVEQLKEALWRENAAVARTMAAMLGPNENVLSPQTGTRCCTRVRATELCPCSILHTFVHASEKVWLMCRWARSDCNGREGSSRLPH